MHTPVLLEEVLRNLQIVRGGKYIDTTAGEGGFVSRIIELGGLVLALDWDKSQIKSLKEQFGQSIQDKRLILECANFAKVQEVAQKHNFLSADGVIFDLGLSMKQIAQSGRGFSYKKLEEPLDMRINEELELTAGEIVNNFSETELYEIFAHHSEEIYSRAIAQSILSTRQMKPINTVGDLIVSIAKAIGKKDTSTYARIFQALRIEVNHEFDNIKLGLRGAIAILKNQGRVAVITFHSVEDRIVKRYIQEQNLHLVNNKVIKGDSKIRYSRSAKLRIIEKYV